MYKKSISFLMVWVILIGSTVSVIGATLKELENEKKANAEKSSTLTEELKKTQEETGIVKNEITALDLELDMVVAKLEETTNELEETMAELATAEEDLENAKIKREEQYEIYKTRVRVMYENGSDVATDITIEAETLVDDIKNREYTNAIAEYDKKVYEDLKATEAFIEDTIVVIERKKSEIEALIITQEADKAALESKIEEKNAMVKKLFEDAEEYGKQLATLEQADKELEAMIKEQEAELARKAELARQAASKSGSGSTYTGPVYTGGKLNWPVPGWSRISSGYGGRNRPIGSGTEVHTGLDIPASTGTSVVAAESGVVTTSGYVNGYGYTIIISHGNGLSTLYGHNSRLVAGVGQTVSRGQEIAKVGSTGNSTGPHCHFEVRVNGRHTSPVPYLN